MRRVQLEVGHQRLGEALHRELGGAVGGMGGVRPDAGPKSVDAAGVDDVALVRLQHHRQKGAAPQIDPAPADVEGPLPLFARIIDETAAPGDAGVVEQQVDLVGVQLLGDLALKPLHLGLVRHVGDVRGDARALGLAVGLAQPRGFRHGGCGHIAHGHVTALGYQLASQFAAHARAAAGDDRDLAGKVLHGAQSPKVIVVRSRRFRRGGPWREAVPGGYRIHTSDLGRRSAPIPSPLGKGDREAVEGALPERSRQPPVPLRRFAPAPPTGEQLSLHNHK